jgi:NADPH2:quinone reductase
MRAAWYEQQGSAADVLQVGELPDPNPAAGEVRVKLTLSAISPGDIKKRQGTQGSLMSFTRVIPHSDGAGVIDAVGDGVDANRVGRRVWVYGAQSYRPFGTAAQLTVVDTHLAIDLPDSVPDELGACLGIPGITAHRAVFGDGTVAGLTVVVHGVLGGVGRFACQLARWGGATVIGTVRRGPDLSRIDHGLVTHAVSTDRSDSTAAILGHAPEGIDRIIEVAFGDHADLDAAVSKNGTVIAAYATDNDRPDFPFWPMLYNNVTIRLLGSDDFPMAAKQQAAVDLTVAASEGALSPAIGTPLSLERIAEAHDMVETGSRTRVLLALPT